MTPTSDAPGYDPRTEDYIAALPAWQADLCRQVRRIAHAADPEVSEMIKRRVQPYFVLHGNVCALLATRDHVNVFLYDGALTDDPEHIITHGHDNTSARQISLYDGDVINEPALTSMLRQIIAHNRAGGWRAVKAERAARGG